MQVAYDLQINYNYISQFHQLSNDFGGTHQCGEKSFTNYE